MNDQLELHEIEDSEEVVLKFFESRIQAGFPSPAQGMFGDTIDLKVFASTIEPCPPRIPVGQVVTDSKKYLKIALHDGFIHLTQVQQAGKKRMPIADFLRGTQLNGLWKVAD